MSMPIHIQIEGKKQGIIKGSGISKNKKNTIVAHAINERYFIPFRKQQGSLSGKPKNAPITIVKEIDKSSPKLFQALVCGEQLSKITLDYYKIDELGSENIFYTQTIEDALITSISSKTFNLSINQNNSFFDLELISFSYKKITSLYTSESIEFKNEECLNSSFAEDFTSLMTKSGESIAKALSYYGHKFSSHMNKNGENLIKKMNSNHCQKLFNDFAWSATLSPTSFLISNSSLTGTGGVINNVPMTKSSAAAIAASLLMKESD